MPRQRPASALVRIDEAVGGTEARPPSTAASAQRAREMFVRGQEVVGGADDGVRILVEEPIKQREVKLGVVDSVGRTLRRRPSKTQVAILAARILLRQFVEA